MHRSLSTQDIKDLRNQCSMSYLISTILFIFGTITGVTIYELYFDSKPQAINFQIAVIIGLAVLFLSVILFFGLNWKYYSDILNSEKIQTIKTLQNKDIITDYYKTTVTLKYVFTVDNVNLTVNKDLFDSCDIGDKLIFNYAPKSKFLLSIEKSGKNS
ncbi:MAG: hypothetical protein IPF54_11510 [Draconibacterium sp.]|nr:hypothetical protein [Draconibacterium sp.]